MNFGSDQGRKWIIAAAVTPGALMAAVDATIINVAIPHLRGVFSATTEEITWVITAYLVAAAVTMPLAAWLAARYGRKRVCLVGLQLFIGSSVACGLASSLSVLVIARVAQGIGAGVLTPTEQVILRETFPPSEQGMAMGIYGATVMLGPALGPLLAGLVIDHLSWSWAFYINLPIGVVGYLLVTRFLPDSTPSSVSKGGMDVPGVALLVIGLGTLHWLFERGERMDWFQATSNTVLLLVAVGSLVMFVAHQLVTPSPMVDLRVLVNRRFAAALMIGAGVSFVVFSTLFLLPIFMQDYLGFSATRTGLALMPRAAVMLVAFPLVGKFYNRFNPRFLIALGLLLASASAVCFARLDLYAGTSDIVWPQILQGLAIPLILTPLSTLALLSVDRLQLSAAAGLNNLARQLGGSLGIVVFASALASSNGRNRGALVHHIVPGDATLAERLAGVSDYFFSLGGMDRTGAVEQALVRLDGRFQSQVAMISLEHAFAWAALLFLALLPVLVLLRAPTPAHLTTQDR